MYVYACMTSDGVYWACAEWVTWCCDCVYWALLDQSPGVVIVCIGHVQDESPCVVIVCVIVCIGHVQDQSPGFSCALAGHAWPDQLSSCCLLCCPPGNVRCGLHYSPGGPTKCMQDSEAWGLPEE